MDDGGSVRRWMLETGREILRLEVGEWMRYNVYMKTINLDDIKKKALPILKEAGVTRSSIFGSYVSGEAREDSDIDMLVDVPKGTGLFGFVGIQLKLEAALGRKVDLVEYATIKPRLKPYILNNQFPIL